MTTTDTDALKERIARALYSNDFPTHMGGWDHARALAKERYADRAAAVLPIVEEEVRKAAKEAWDQCAMEQATWPRPAGDPRALTFVLLANNPYGDEEKR